MIKAKKHKEILGNDELPLARPTPIWGALLYSSNDARYGEKGENVPTKQIFYQLILL